ncbi:hypothetical protein LCGC14_2464070 [marine sediment metagenome]|uniref:Uncharacterized protein n=1 Tax=marine sediment metagenome TaxID=412755 RepID=A0A0F9BCD4_9ZZZZ
MKKCNACTVMVPDECIVDRAQINTGGDTICACCHVECVPEDAETLRDQVDVQLAWQMSEPRMKLAVTTARICDSADTQAIENGAYSDGYNASPGVMAVIDNMRPDGTTLSEIWENGFSDDADQREFLTRLLGDLNEDEEFLDSIRNLSEGETRTHTEYWGDRITIEFRREHGTIVATFPADDTSLRVICD